MMPKQYGLILPGQPKQVAPPVREVAKPTIFDDSSDSDEPNMPQLKMRNAPIAPGVMERRIARSIQDKALAEDPTVYQYDELYDEMENKREAEKQLKSLEPKKPKYIVKLLETAERRKLENDLRIERQVQKEREAEGEQFKDKESFVTAAYRKKLEDMRQLEEQEKRDEYLEAIGDVTKQKDLDGFYRHIYEQKTGTSKEVCKPTLPNTSSVPDDEEIAYKPITSGRAHQRAYRKRRTSDDERKEALIAEENEAKKVHLQNNIDADSDFSIDSSSGESDNDEDTNNVVKTTTQPQTTQNTVVTDTDPSKIALKFDVIKKKDKDENEASENLNETPAVDIVPEAPKPKRDKSEVWKKRTVGAVFEDAVKRYFERREIRNA